MKNLIVVAVAIAMMFGLVLSAEAASYREDIAEAKLRYGQRFKSNYSLKNKPSTAIPATVLKGSRVVGRSAVSEPITRRKVSPVVNMLTTRHKSSPVTGMPATVLKGSRVVGRSAVGESIIRHRVSSVINRPHDPRILRMTPASFRANRGSVLRPR